MRVVASRHLFFDAPDGGSIVFGEHSPPVARHADLLDFHGVSRSVLEQRIIDLVAAMADLERRSRDLEGRLRGRLEMNERTRFAYGLSPDDAALATRITAYQCALDDLRELLLP